MVQYLHFRILEFPLTLSGEEEKLSRPQLPLLLELFSSIT
jgi:hypothetical protein